MTFLTEGYGATFVTPVRVQRKIYISMYFLKKIVSHFAPKEKISCFREKNTIFPDNTRKIKSQRNPFWKDHLFRTFEENIIFPCIFWERSSFIFRLRGKIIFSGKRNIIFTDNTRKIIFQHDFFGKTIFSRRLEKENTVFRAVHIFSKRYKSIAFYKYWISRLNWISHLFVYVTLYSITNVMLFYLLSLVV